jgi:hypothetical protein
MSVSLSGGGNTAIVGGPLDNDGTGASWVFTRSGGVWNQQAKLVGTDTDGIANGAQGWSVSLAGDASTAIVGGIAGVTGAAFVFAQPVFAGTPAKANCHGQSVSALARQYGGLNSAAAALGYGPGDHSFCWIRREQRLKPWRVGRFLTKPSRPPLRLQHDRHPVVKFRA